MMDWDPLAAEFPARVALEEDELEAEARASDVLQRPLVVISPSASMNSQKLEPDLLVIATGAPACNLLFHGLEDKKIVGSIVFPDQDLGGNTIAPSASNKMAYIASTNNASTLSISCQYEVKDERALLWVDALFSRVEPKNVLVLGNIKTEDLNNCPTNGEIVYGVCSSFAKPVSVPRLPSGNLLRGLPAAILTYAELHRMPAWALMDVDVDAGFGALWPSMQRLSSSSEEILRQFGVTLQPSQIHQGVVLQQSGRGRIYI